MGRRGAAVGLSPGEVRDPALLERRLEELREGLHQRSARDHGTEPHLYYLRFWVEGQPQPNPDSCPDGNVAHHESAWSAVDAIIQAELWVKRTYGNRYFHLCRIEPA